MQENSVGNMSRRELLGTVGRAVVLSVALPPATSSLFGMGEAAAAEPLNAVAGVDRVVMLHGRTYLNGWVGYGEPPRRNRPRGGATATTAAPERTGPPPSVVWAKESGPGDVAFDDAHATTTTATFSAPGEYVLKLTVRDDAATMLSTVQVTVELPPPAELLQAVYTKPFSIDSRLWSDRAKALMVNWIPHCIDQINRDDLPQGAGGIDNFIEAAKALQGQPHGAHKGYVFSNAWVHQTVEAMSIALMIDRAGDQQIIATHAKMRATLDDWIPKILAAREPDGYLHTAFTLRNRERWAERWSPQGRAHHEGYVAGYFLESAINHYLMTDRKDSRLYDAAKQLADCWYDNIGIAEQ